MRNTFLGLGTIAMLGAFSFSGIAEEAAAPVDTSAAQAAVLKNASGAMEARQHLVRQGYINISDLIVDERGRWTGTAQKDGKTVIVALNLRDGKPTIETN